MNPYFGSSTLTALTSQIRSILCITAPSPNMYLVVSRPWIAGKTRSAEVAKILGLGGGGWRQGSSRDLEFFAEFVIKTKDILLVIKKFNSVKTAKVALDCNNSNNVTLGNFHNSGNKQKNAKNNGRQ